MNQSKKCRKQCILSNYQFIKDPICVFLLIIRIFEISAKYSENALSNIVCGANQFSSAEISFYNFFYLFIAECLLL